MRVYQEEVQFGIQTHCIVKQTKNIFIPERITCYIAPVTFGQAALQVMEHVVRRFPAARNKSRGADWEERGLRALLDLTRERGAGSPILRTEINRRAGITSPSAGQWSWTQAGVVEKCKIDERVHYKIRDEFYDAAEEVMSEHT